MAPFTAVVLCKTSRDNTKKDEQKRKKELGFFHIENALM
jgi:hypothetical protein